MNEYDSERITYVLENNGWIKTLHEHEADLLLVNTCTVRQLAEHKTFSLIGRWAQLKLSKPKLLIGMVGCLAQHIQLKAFQKSTAIDFLAGSRAIDSIPNLAERALREKLPYEFSIHPYEFAPGASQHKQSISTFVAVMEGCNQFCTYCAVPYARGRELSRSKKVILEEIRVRIEHGAKEIVLLAQNISRYGLDLGYKEGLADLLNSVASIPGLKRLRFLTSHPSSLTDETIRAMADIPQICEALHLPLQSGSNRILKLMNRGYSTQEYNRLVERLRNQIPNLALSTDIIVGFPGETEDDFNQTLNLVRQIGFAMAYCFKFSPRKNTRAAEMIDDVSKSQKKIRLESLLNLVESSSIEQKAKMVGQILPVLIERFDPKNDQRLQGRSRTNHIVHLIGPSEWIGREFFVKISSASRWSVIGEVLHEVKT